MITIRELADIDDGKYFVELGRTKEDGSEALYILTDPNDPFRFILPTRVHVMGYAFLPGQIRGRG